LSQNQRSEENKQRRRKKKKSGFWRKFGISVGTLFLVGVLTVGIFASIFMTYVNTALKDDLYVDVEGITLQLSSKIMYQQPETGQWRELQTLYADENRIPVKYGDLPDFVEKALVAIEDKRFYEHKGVDWKSTAKAIFTMFFGSENRGGSTLTQQLIKNLTGDNEVTVKRKVTEIFRALEFEKRYNKWEIVEMYLNTVYFGQQCYGIGAAAKTYFGKTVQELTVAEAAAIIGITNSPTANDPLRSETCRGRCLDRKNTILYEMWDQGKLTDEEYEVAKNQKLIFVGDPDYVPSGEEDVTEQNEHYSWFTDQVIRDVIAELVEQKGISEEVARTLLYSAGYTIYSTMNPTVQEAVDLIYNDTANLPYTSVSGQQLQSAITITDPATGNIVAMSGGMGEKEGSLLDNRAYNERPCGSAIKPLSVYSLALETGALNAASVLDDYPVLYDREQSRAWPKNAYVDYRGLNSLAFAIINSSNTCAVRTLDLVGAAASYDWMTNKLGFTTLVPSDMDRGPLGLGGLTYGVTTVEMAAAYAAFANNGIYTTPRTFTRIEDKNGQLVLENHNTSWAAMSEETVFTINDLLKKVVSTGTGTAAKFQGMTIAGKTGTTTNNYDRYFVGYTPYYCAAVWIGYDYMENISASGNPAAMLWNKVMSVVHEGLENKDFIGLTAADMTSATVCTKSGMLATDLCTACGHVQTVLMPEEQVPTEECTVHVTYQVCVHTDAEGNETFYEPGGMCSVFGTLRSEIMLDYAREVVTYIPTVKDEETGEITEVGEEYVTEVARDSKLMIRELEDCPNHGGGMVDPIGPSWPDDDPDVDDPANPGTGGSGNFWDDFWGDIFG